MGFRFRKSKSFGPFRLNLSKRGPSVSARAGRASVSKRGVSVRLLPGLSWFMPRKRRR